jgi:hypothetical protein
MTRFMLVVPVLCSLSIVEARAQSVVCSDGPFTPAQGWDCSITGGGKYPKVACKHVDGPRASGQLLNGQCSGVWEIWGYRYKDGTGSYESSCSANLKEKPVIMDCWRVNMEKNNTQTFKQAWNEGAKSWTEKKSCYPDDSGALRDPYYCWTFNQPSSKVVCHFSRDALVVVRNFGPLKTGPSCPSGG